MYRLGLTGSLATGKSTVLKLFADENIPVYSADEAVHDLYEEVDGAAVTAIAGKFPEAVKEGRVDRKVLGRIVLKDRRKLMELENIMHPLVAQKIAAFVGKEAGAGEELVVIEIPLLFESAQTFALDGIAVTICPDEVQHERALSRSGMNVEKMESILARQMPQSEKVRRADFIIDTSNSLPDTREMVRSIIKNCRRD